MANGRQITNFTDNTLMKDTLKLLERGEREIVLRDDKRNVVLILGNTGSGKSTFTQWIAGDNTKLIAKEVGKGTGEYIIEDNNRIGNSTLKSKTVFPELVIDPKTSIAYYDCPGFVDSRSTSNELATTFFIKKVLDHAKSVKMIFTVSYPSVRKGVDRQDFMKLLRHATDLIRDIDKFESSFAMIVTKVDNIYIKKGNSFVLVEDTNVLEAIADFLSEVQRYLGERTDLPDISDKERQLSENASRFISKLLIKDNQQYSSIGIFRRPDQAGPLSNVTLLQQGKEHVENILYEKLKFTEKADNDFGHTVSERSKNDIKDLMEEINQAMWSNLSEIAENVRDYFKNLIKQIRTKIKSFNNHDVSIEADLSEAQEFSAKLTNGYRITSDMVEQIKNVQDIGKVAKEVIEVITSLDINVHRDTLVYILNQRKFFEFLQTVSGKDFSSRTWEDLYTPIITYISESKAIILEEAINAAGNTGERIQDDLNSIAKIIQSGITGKMKMQEVQKMPEWLDAQHKMLSKMTESITNSTTTEELMQVVGKNARVLGIIIPKTNQRNISRQIKCLKYLESIAGIDLDTGSSERMRPFTDVINFVNESKSWYKFLNSLYETFFDYGIQKDRQRYNVADLDDWGKPEKPQGIAITSSTYDEFLNKISAYNIDGYDEVKNATATELQLEELNNILYLTLKHKTSVDCTGKQAFVKGDFVSLWEVMTQASSDKYDCRDFLARLKSGSLESVNIFALNTLFLDHDVLLQGLEVHVFAIAPRWEVIGERRIDLSGFAGVSHSNPKAKEGFSGEPGKSGGPGGVFFGVGESYVNGANLTVTATGGLGGPGQDGGNGQKGRDGRTASLPDDATSRNRLECCRDGKTSNGFRCEKTVLSGNLPRYGKLDWGDSVRYYNFQHEDYKLYGLPGKRGGDGSSGGRGGKGGHPGSVTVVELNKPSAISKLANAGVDGKDGLGGSGGKAGIDGGDATARCLIRRPNWCLLCVRDKENIQWVLDENLSNNRRNTAGKDGISGANTANREYPKPKKVIHEPASIINQYKMFLRENMANRFKKYTLERFHDLLNLENKVREVYDTLGLVDEMRGLENQYAKLNTKVNFVSFYHSLLERVDKYALHPKSGENSKEYKKVLGYLYAAILSRIRNLSESSESDLIIDISKYLETVVEGIESLKDLEKANNKADAIRRINEEYKTRISTKMQEATDFAQRIITPEISRINNQIDDKVEVLIEETLLLQKTTEDEKKDLIAKREELHNKLMLKALFDNFKIVGRVVSFLGPFGTALGSALEATTSVVESLALDREQRTLDLSGIATNMNSLGEGIKTLRTEKIDYLNNLFEELSRRVIEHPKELGDLTSQVDGMKTRLSQISENKYDLKEVKTLEAELLTTLEKKEIDLKTEDNSSKKNVNVLAIVGKIKQLAQFGSFFLDIYNRNRENEEKMDVLTEAIAKKENELEILREYEDRIYDTITPMLQTMEREIQEVAKKLEGKSQVALDVTKWQVQNVLKDIKTEMLRLTGRFEVKDELARCIEKLEEVMTTLISVYDRIERYKDEITLSDYIMNISSDSASSIPVKNSTLSSAINQLDWSIRSNLVLKQYKTTIHAFKQWVFPFARYYLEPSLLPSHLQFEEDIEDLVNKAVIQIRRIKRKLELYKSSVKETDERLFTREFSSRYVSSEPFFSWNNDQYGNEISQLLSGKEIVLKADVKKSEAGKDAIKFRSVELYFKSKNETIQSQLNAILKKFDISATHFGNSYYRYDDRIHVISSPKRTIFYSFEKNSLGEPIHKNQVYKKLILGDLMLSPYAMWSFKLNTTKKNAFLELEIFKGLIDLELEGNGSYVAGDADFLLENYETDLEPGFSEKSSIAFDSNNRYIRSPDDADNTNSFATSSATKLSSPFSYISNFLKIYSVFVMISVNKLLFNYNESSKSTVSMNVPERASAISSNPSKIFPAVGKLEENFSNVPVNDSFTKPGLLKRKSPQRIIKKHPAFFQHYNNGTGNKPNSGSRINYFVDDYANQPEPDLLDEQSNRQRNHRIQEPDLNCSLFLADFVARYFTGIKYESGIENGVLSPQRVIARRISGCILQSDNDINQNLFSLLESKETSGNFLCSKLKNYAFSAFRFLGLVKKENPDDFILDIKNLFVFQEAYDFMISETRFLSRELMLLLIFLNNILF